MASQHKQGINHGLTLGQIQELMASAKIKANLVVSELDASITQVTFFDSKLSTIIFMRYKGGAHYTCVYIDGSEGIYYDSTDRTDIPPELLKMYGGKDISHSSRWLQNNLQTQQNHMCGHYCVAFIKFMNGKDISTVYKKLFHVLDFNNEFLGHSISKAERIFRELES